MSNYWMSPLARDHAAAALAAERIHVRLSTDRTERIDVFRIIEDAGVWLMFQPMRTLYGAFVRESEATGVLINGSHPLNLQRFTAAHEYGHYILGHNSSIDDEKHIEPFGQDLSLSPEEAAAQTFAAYFLMPLQLVNITLLRMGLQTKPESLSSHQVYSLSLHLGVSYSATVNHLLTLKKIGWAAAAELRRKQPKEIKREISSELPLQDPWADTWLLDERDADRLIRPRVNDELHIRLPDIPSTGYIWTTATEEVVDQRGNLSTERSIGAHLALVDDKFELPAHSGESVPFGASGTHRFVFRTLRSGPCTLRLNRRRPWQPETAPAETFTAKLQILTKQTGTSDRGLSERQKPLLGLVA